MSIEPIYFAYLIVIVLAVACGILSHYANQSKNKESSDYKNYKYYLSFSIVCGILIIPLLYFIVIYHKNRMERPLPVETGQLFPTYLEEKLRRTGARM